MSKLSDIDAVRLLDDPANFLHSIDVEGNRAFFVRTTPQLLREASFVDGRIPIATAEPQSAPLSDLTALELTANNQDRLIFNCSFCGSTQLARLLDVPGRSLVLKEPRCLTDIAAWKVFNQRDRMSITQLRPTLAFARAALRRRFTSNEVVTVKVANQGNVLLDTLTDEAARIRPVFITISRLNFLRAIFRGGVERMHHAATIAWHMATTIPDGELLLREAVAADADPLRKAANLAILARYLQVGAFKRAAQAGRWSENQVVDYELIKQSPLEATSKAARALNLEIDENDIELNVARLSSYHSKQTGKHFDSVHSLAADNRLYKTHRQLFRESLDWADRAFGPELAVVG